jgi:predicted dehydrogenase
MITTVRVGVIGTSWYPDWLHLPVLKSHSNAVIQAICGRNRSRAAEMAAKYEIPSVFTDYQEMIEQANLDAVVIAVPDDLHFPITMAALENGLHVLCEKPMAFDLAQARTMLAKAEAAHVRHMTFFTYRWVPSFRILHKLISEGYIGKCYDAHFVYAAGYARQGYYQWKWDRQHGLGVLGDLGSHMIDMARWLVGDITRVQANLKTRVEKPHPQGLVYPAANDTAHLMVEFAGGASGMIYASAAVELGNRGQVQQVTLSGDQGTLEATSDGNGWIVRGIRAGETDFQEMPVPAEFLLGSYRDEQPWDQQVNTFKKQSIGTRLFIDGILEERPVAPSFYEGMKAQEVIEAAFQSHEAGCWVDIK